MEEQVKILRVIADSHNDLDSLTEMLGDEFDVYFMYRKAKEEGHVIVMCCNESDLLAEVREFLSNMNEQEWVSRGVTSHILLEE